MVGGRHAGDEGKKIECWKEMRQIKELYKHDNIHTS